ncbi:MAG: DUF2461 domain-containing protein [Ectothiorhodospiraceae bacterium]|nr:DUF2461 domain-containing protein [Ectothiorhodospiraceae bacterium]
MSKKNTTSPYFSKSTFTFLTDLSRHNQREWFNDNKQRYEECVRGPALAFIDDIAPELQLIAPRFLAIPKKVGGSLMRVHRDVRFGKDKTPYKTNIGIQFRHEVGKNIHAPGYYLHLSPHECFFGVGIWRPDSSALGDIREAIRDKGEKWLAAKDEPTFQEHFALGGESLKNAPRGYAKDHPLLKDLKRKDFIAIEHFDRGQTLSEDFLHETVAHYDYATKYMQFLCSALNVRFD